MNTVNNYRNNANQKVCIVGVVGRFHLYQEGSSLNQLLNTDIFKGSKQNNLKEINLGPGTAGKQVRSLIDTFELMIHYLPEYCNII